ncbi:MAG TPA: beta-propeller fold lactonase family protein [Terriglobales bacterium]|nr:beta-propeller fold lactonase family protein [Terriglobales bacterium]
MLKKTGVVMAVLGIATLNTFLMSCGSGSNRPSGLLYVVSQSLSNISSYAVNLNNGNLSLITNNLADTCADSSCGLPLTMSLDPSGATAFVLSQGAISGYTVNSGGSLSQPTTAATMPSGQTALAMASTAAGDMMAVISTGGPNPTDCLQNGQAYDPNTNDCPLISIYSTNPGSTSVTLTGNECSALSGPCPYVLSRMPTSVSILNFTFPNQPSKTLLLVSSNHDLTSAHNDSEVSMFFVDSSGNLTEQSSSPYSAQAPNPLSVKAVNTNPSGQNIGGVFVYVGNQAAVTGSVSSWEVCTQADSVCSQQDVDNGNMRAIGKVMSVGQNPTSILVDPTNTFMYVACYVGNNVYAFRMTTGTGILTALSPALEPTGAGPVALAMHASVNNTNEFLYVANNTASTISGYTVNLTSGALSNPMAPFIFTPGNPYGIAGR